MDEINKIQRESNLVVRGLPEQTLAREEVLGVTKDKKYSNINLQGWPTINRTGTNKLIKGTKTQNDKSKIKAVEKQICLFVGRLHKDTTEEELEAHLADYDIHNVKCKKLHNNYGRSFNTAAFQLYAPARYEDTLYDPDTWPEDCSVREWIFKTTTFINRRSSQSLYRSPLTSVKSNEEMEIDNHKTDDKCEINTNE